MSYRNTMNTNILLSEKYKEQIRLIEKYNVENDGGIYTPELLVNISDITTGVTYAGIADIIFVHRFIETRRIQNYGGIGQSKTGSATVRVGPITLIIKSGQYDNVILSKYHDAVIKKITIKKLIYKSTQEFPAVSETREYDHCQIIGSEIGHPDWSIFEFNCRMITIETESFDQTHDGSAGQTSLGKSVYIFDAGKGSFKNTK